MRKFATLAPVLLVLGLNLLTTGGAANATPLAHQDVPIQALPVVVLPPEVDPFYKAPADEIANTPPGGIIKARQITPAVLSLVPLNIDAWQVLYRTNDSHGHPIATATTLLKPRGETPQGGRKLLSYQIAEDSTAAYCSMSYVVQQGSIPVDYVNSGEVTLAIAFGISEGWAVAIPDYQGPNSAYGAAILGGQATLDGIRAAENFAPMQLDGARTQVGLMGYSGGTIPTGWAAENRDTYAPELNIAGITMGGVVHADLPAVLRQNNFNIGAGLIGGALFGFATEYPEVKDALDTKVDWFGRFMMTTKSFICHPQNSVLFPFWNFLGDFQGPGDPLQLPAIKNAIADNALGKHVPTVPMLIYHAQNDELIPNAGTDRLVNDFYCKDPNASISYTREYLAEHISGLVAWWPEGLQFMHDRLNGVPAQQGCTITSPYTTWTNGDFANFIGQKWPALAGLVTGAPVGALFRK